MTDHSASSLTVLCLCADWCGVCRDYRPGYEALADEHARVDFHWIDIEDESEWPDELEVESFPTVLIQRGDAVLYFGPTLPQHGHLRRTIAEFAQMDAAAAREYANATEERRRWQAALSFSARLGR